MKTAYLFPGQGAQHVGMGMGLCESSPTAARLFDEAERLTSLPLKKLCFEGPLDDLSRTDVAQPALFTVSAAILTCLDEALSEQRREEMQPGYLAGLSLGEYTALYAAGSIDFATGVKLVARRGQLMQNAALATPSGMVSVIGLDVEQARELCDAAADGQVLGCANFNCPGQIVLSGEIEACKRVEELAERFGAKAAIPLQVAGAFHSELMKPAADEFASALDEVSFAEPGRPVVISNVDALPYDGAGTIRAKLLAQLTSPVRWQQSMEFLIAEGVEQFYEIGPGKVLTGLMRRIDRKKSVTRINGLDDVEKLACAA